MPTPSSSLSERLGLRIPLIQAPMAGVSTPHLAAAVSRAGALGSLGLGASTVAQARQAILDTRALTDRPFAVNLFCHAPARHDPAREAAWLAHLAPLFAEVQASPPAALHEIYRSFVEDETMLALLLELRPAAVSFHFGLPPRDWVQALRAAGMYTLATATSVQEADRIAEAGVDALVAQGIEAGGHRGLFDPAGPDACLPTADLVRDLVGHTALPIVAAGGLMRGQDIRAMLALGAVAAQLGTAFIACPESAASDSYRTALLHARGSDTRLTSVFSGRPARGIANRFMTWCEAPGSPPPPDYPIAYDAAKQLHAAAQRQGVGAHAACWAGTGVARARALPAAELVATLAAELNA